jgi:hypothetical protein
VLAFAHESLDGETDENAEAAWSVEISPRLAQLDSGSVKTIPWEEARRLILGSTDADATGLVLQHTDMVLTLGPFPEKTQPGFSGDSLENVL